MLVLQNTQLTPAQTLSASMRIQIGLQFGGPWSSLESSKYAPFWPGKRLNSVTGSGGYGGAAPQGSVSSEDDTAKAGEEDPETGALFLVHGWQISVCSTAVS